ncbi:MAG: general stress protein [Fimbriimonadaceae bacterium]
MSDHPLKDHSIAVYANHDQAEAAVKCLSDAGFSMRNLSIIGQNYETEEHPIGFINTGERMKSWGKLGAFWGTIWGLVFGSAMIFVPGFGYLMFAGWIVAGLEGMVIGAGLGTLTAALVSLGIPHDSVIQYETAVKEGNFLVLAHGSDSEVQRAKDLLDLTPALRVDRYKPLEKVAN